MDAQGNRGWTRSTTASRRAERVIRWVHQSKAVVPSPEKVGGWIVAPVEGVTFNVGSNAAKRKNRRAHIKARKAARRAA